MDEETENVLMYAGAEEYKRQRRAKGLPDYSSDPIVIQRCAELLRKVAERSDG